jgi:hypothetical protein
MTTHKQVVGGNEIPRSLDGNYTENIYSNNLKCNDNKVTKTEHTILLLKIKSKKFFTMNRGVMTIHTNMEPPIGCYNFLSHHSNEQAHFILPFSVSHFL